MKMKLFETPRDKGYLSKSSASPSKAKGMLSNYLDHVEYVWQRILAQHNLYDTTAKGKYFHFVMDRSAAYATYIRVIAVCAFATSLVPISRRYYDQYDIFDLALGVIAPPIIAPLYIVFNALFFVYETMVLFLGLFIPFMHEKKDWANHLDRWDDAYVHAFLFATISPIYIGLIIAANALKLIIGVPAAAIATACIGPEEPVAPRFLCRNS